LDFLSDSFSILFTGQEMSRQNERAKDGPDPKGKGRNRETKLKCEEQENEDTQQHHRGPENKNDNSRAKNSNGNSISYSPLSKNNTQSHSPPNASPKSNPPSPDNVLPLVRLRYHFIMEVLAVQGCGEVDRSFGRGV
jgi:hypothetical protein